MAKTAARSRKKEPPPDVTAPAAPARPLRGADQQANRDALNRQARPTRRHAPPPPPPVEDNDDFHEFPLTMYHQQKVSAKFPNGYEARQFADEAALEKAGKGWKESPEGMTPDVPHGHEE